MINNLLIHTTWRKKLSEILSEILGQGQGQGQGFFICHMINYTGYNQKWNVVQIRSAQWTVQRIKKKKIYI